MLIFQGIKIFFVLFLQLFNQGVKLNLNRFNGLFYCAFLSLSQFCKCLLCFLMHFISYSCFLKCKVHFLSDRLLKLMHVSVSELLYPSAHFYHLFVHLHVIAFFNNGIELFILIPLIYQDLLLKITEFLVKSLIFRILLLLFLLLQSVFKGYQIYGRI